MIDFDVEVEVSDWKPESVDVIAMLVAGLVIRLGFRLYTLFGPTGSTLGVIVPVYVLASGLVVMLLAVSDFDLATHGQLVAGILLAVLAGITGVVFGFGAKQPIAVSDAILFSHYSADLVASGKNPFAASMQPAWKTFGVSRLSYTPTLDGGHVASLSYPAGAVLAFLPAALLGEIGRFGLSSGIAIVLTAGLLIAWSKPEAALAPLVVVLSADMFQMGWLGTTDIFWVLPVLLTIRAWATGRRSVAAITYGIACSVKQQPWFIGPFLVLWIIHEHIDDGSGLRDGIWAAGRWTLSAVATFLVVNLPFVLWNPTAWLSSVFTPLGSGPTLIQNGIGLAALSSSGVYALPKTWFLLALGSASIVALAAYWRLFPFVKWTAWMAPSVLLFFHYRSLASYFLWILPIAYLAVIEARGLSTKPSTVTEHASS